MGRRRQTHVPVPDLILVTAGLRVLAVVSIVALFIAGVTVGALLGLNW